MRAVTAVDAGAVECGLVAAETAVTGTERMPECLQLLAHFIIEAALEVHDLVGEVHGGRGQEVIIAGCVLAELVVVGVIDPPNVERTLLLPADELLEFLGVPLGPQAGHGHADHHRPHYAQYRHGRGFAPERKDLSYALVCDRTEGPYVYDLDGNEYIDYCLGYGPLLFGHSPKDIVQAVVEEVVRHGR